MRPFFTTLAASCPQLISLSRFTYVTLVYIDRRATDNILKKPCDIDTTMSLKVVVFKIVSTPVWCNIVLEDIISVVLWKIIAAQIILEGHQG